MCGISGIISLNHQKVNSAQIVAMSDEMIKRGPDGEGYLITNNDEYSRLLKNDRKDALVISLQHSQCLTLGHRRLATTDLNCLASQPMTDVTERYAIVYNGQIYNHIELRKELVIYGYKFKTDHSDTEVILNAYSHWGIDCLQKFNGMWAFCIWDTVENTFFISRDRVGKQPVFYSFNNGLFYFASELNALLKSNTIERAMDEHSIYDYLTYTNVPAPNTIYKKIKKLPAAHYLFFKPGEQILTKRYWNPVKLTKTSELSEVEIIEQIREKLYESTRLRMQSDVQVGMLLSGGLDSSINLACMSKYSNEPVRTYTVGFENNSTYQNEFKYSRIVASHYKANYKELLIGEKEFFDSLPTIAYCQDEPIADTANIPIYLVSELAQQDGTKILISGEGSDELFIGYEHWRLIYEFEKLFRNRPKLASYANALHKNSFLKNKGKHYENWYYKVKNNWPVFWSGTEVNTEATKHSILTKDFLNKIGSYNSFMPIADLYESMLSIKPYETFEWMTISDLQNRFPDQLLARLDRMMMACSIEGRNPFLDVNLIELTLTIPSSLKIKNKTEKHLLKQAFKNILPDEVINRPKDSFTIPLNNLFKNENRKKEHIAIIEEFNREKDIFSKHYIKQLECPSNIKNFWNILNLALWYKQHK
jgi:asparagine synthase (glutamine-hydrolysing)